MYALLCFGDSITHGRGESPNLGWVGRLKENFESRDYYNAVYNLGIPGEISTDLLKRIEVEAKSRIRYIREGDRFVIIIAVGLNDSRGIESPDNTQVPIEIFEKNIEEMYNISNKYTKDIVFISPTPVNENLVNPYENTYLSNTLIKKYNLAIKKLAEKHSLNYIDIFDKLDNNDYISNLGDGLHPNSKAYNLMFELVKDELEKKELI